MNNHKFVGRAGEKLDFALKKFKIEAKNRICADFGSAVGGFVDCLLHHGAKKVYAVEKGYGVLAWSLRKNPKVVVLEKTDAMRVSLPEKADLLTIDTGWTRQKNIIPNALKQVKPKGFIITLIKPHYEVGRGKLPEKEAEKIAKKTVEDLEVLGVELKGLLQSPLLGRKAKNSEYFAFLKRCPSKD